MSRSLPWLIGSLLLTLTAVTAAAAPTSPAGVPDAEVSRVLGAYRAARPADRDLQVFKLDWAGSLKEAKARAAKEGRPILFVATTQLEDAGDLRGGHC